MNDVAALAEALSRDDPDPQGGFARDLADWFGGTPEVFLFFKGRVAIHAVCRALGLGAGDDVVLPGYTCMVVPEAFLGLGARPLYVDIDPVTFNAPPDAMIAALTPRTRLVLVQHTYGIPADVGPVVEACRARGIPVLEDACHAFGTTVGGRPAGTVGAAGVLSGQWNKPFSTGLGGMLLVNDPALADAVRREARSLVPPTRYESRELAALVLAHAAVVTPRTYAFAQTAYRALADLGVVTGSSSRDELAGRLPPDYFKGMTDTQARVGRLRARSFAAGTSYRRNLQALYRDLLPDAGFDPGPDVPGTVLSRYPVRVAEKSAVLAAASRRGLELGSWFETPLHPAPLLRHSDFGYAPGSCPHAERAAREVVNLPVNERTGDADARRVVAFLATTARPA